MKRICFILTLLLITIAGRSVVVEPIHIPVFESHSASILPLTEFHIDLLTYETRSQSYQSPIDLPERFYVKVVGKRAELCLPTFFSMREDHLLDNEYTVSYSGDVEQLKAKRDKKGVCHISFRFLNKGHKEKILITIFNENHVIVEWKSSTNQWNGGSFIGRMR